MIELTVLRPGNRWVTARYDAEQGHWLCEDADFYRVLRSVQLPSALDYQPDPPLALVKYVAGLYHGEVKDLRNWKPAEVDRDKVY